MDLISKPFAALATHWRADVFNRARLKLTGLYLIVMCLVTAIFSIALYFNVTKSFRISVRNSLRSEVDQRRFFEDRDSDVLGGLLLIDGVILLLSTVSSYVFAGYTLKPIKSALKAQEQFAADAAHELRTPLTVIQTQIEVLLRSQESLSTKVQGTLSSVLDETKELTAVTSDLLTLAREAADTKPKATHSTSLIAAIEEAIRYSKNPTKEKQITIRFEPTEDVQLQGSELILKRIFLNLLDNATKYTSTGGTIKILIDNSSPSLVTITIKDTGVGIAKSDLPRIFERFYQADTARRTKGAGLGLFIVKQLVNSHGGTIRFESELNQGTTVLLQLKKVD